MKKRLLIVTDLGLLRIYSIEENELPGSHRLELLHELSTGKPQKLSEQTSDQAGQFGKGTRSFAAVNDMENGERHNILLEENRRTLRRIARRIEEVCRQAGVESILLAADHEINRQLVEELSPELRARIEQNEAANLARLGKQELLARFDLLPVSAARSR